MRKKHKALQEEEGEEEACDKMDTRGGKKEQDIPCEGGTPDRAYCMQIPNGCCCAGGSREGWQCRIRSEVFRSTQSVGQNIESV
jgi:hypothetical protein